MPREFSSATSGCVGKSGLSPTAFYGEDEAGAASSEGVDNSRSLTEELVVASVKPPRWGGIRHT